MNNELAMRTFACLISHYKENNETTINSEEIEAIEFLIKENQELKKQLEQNKNPLRGIFAQVNDDTLLRNCGAMQSEINGYKTQQKEFIKWLENGIEQVKNTEFFDERIQRAGLIAYNRVLSKYKEIIGDDK